MVRQAIIAGFLGILAGSVIVVVVNVLVEVMR